MVSGKSTVLQIGRSLVRSQLVSVEFFIDIKYFRSHYGPGVDSASNRWIPGVFPGGKGGRCLRLTTYDHPVLLSWNPGTLTSWNPLGQSRPVMGLVYLYTLCWCTDYSNVFKVMWHSVWIRKPTRCHFLYSLFSSNCCSTCFGQPCTHHQGLTTAWCYSLVLVCAVAAGRWSSPFSR